MKYQDYYKILGVARDASQDDIKKAYRRLARKYHPDVSKEKNAEARFKELGQAYEVLKDPEKRSAYDDLGRYQAGQDFRPPPGWKRQHARGQGFSEDLGGVDLGDLFSDLFGMGGARTGASTGRGFQSAGQDFGMDVEISLTEAYYGAERNLQVEVPEPDARGRMHRVPKTIKLRIPKGATTGQKLRVRGKGGRGLGGGPAGDLYLTIRLAAHPYMKADRHDIYLDVPLTPWEAALGCDIEVPTIEGRVRLRVRGGARAGQKLRLTGKGLPKPGGGQGDLYAILQITTPPNLSEKQKQLFEQLAADSNYDPRASLWSKTV